MNLSPNTRLGRYEIRSLLGTGGMGEVYLAYDTSLRRQVAIKLLPAEFTQNKVRLGRFEREAYAASSLNHPNILTIHEIGEEDGNHYIAAEYVEGESLRQHISRAPMELREILDVTQQVAAALGAAHEAGIVHRDIKPENVMLRRDGFVKVLDFGLAKLAGETSAAQQDTDAEARTRTKVYNTEPGIVMGTASYMSPEQARGLEVDARTDIWSLGVMLYEMVSGRLPFEGATTTDVLAMILHREPASLLLNRSNVPAELEWIVEKALAKERQERYQLAKELAVDLRRLKQHLEMEAELERSITPEEGARRAAGQTGTAIRAATVSGTSRVAAETQTADAIPTRTTSSAEYIIGEIKQHKRGAALLLAAVVIAVAAGFSYFSYFGTRSQAISSIAVLPFVNASGDPNSEYLSDGISESLIDKLSQLPGLKVIARSSAFKYKGKEVDPQEVSNALGVQVILSGRVVQRGDQLQVRAELINARDKTQLWGEQYNRQVTDLQAVQEEIARTISDKLRVRLTGAEATQLSKRATTNPEVYQLYLNGVFYRRKGGFENSRRALDFQNRAVALDPGFALAWTEVAANYRYLASNSMLDPKEANPKSKAAVQKALELDDTQAEAHAMLARIKTDEWDWTGAEPEYKRAIELNPNLAEAHSWYSSFLSRVGRHTEALAEIKRAQELDPLLNRLKSVEASALYFARRYDEAVQLLQRTVDTEPDGIAHAFLGYTYAATGKYGEAVAEYQKSMSIDGENTSDLCFMGYALGRSGKRSEAQTILEKLKSTKQYVSPTELAILHIGLGDKEAAIASLEKGYAAHDLQMLFLKVDQHYDSLRADPRFTELVRKVGFPQ